MIIQQQEETKILKLEKFNLQNNSKFLLIFFQSRNIICKLENNIHLILFGKNILNRYRFQFNLNNSYNKCQYYSKSLNRYKRFYLFKLTRFINNKYQYSKSSNRYKRLCLFKLTKFINNKYQYSNRYKRLCLFKLTKFINKKYQLFMRGELLTDLLSETHSINKVY